MAYLLGVLQAIAALPAILKSFKDFVADMEEKFGPDWMARLQDLRTASTQWQGAQTDAERIAAAKAMSSAFNSHK